MPFPLVAAGIAAGVGGLGGALSNIFGKKKKEWTDADLTKFGWQDYDTGEANKFLLRNAANLINRRKTSANAKAAQFGLDPVSSSYQMEDDIMDGVAGQAGDIYAKGVESSQNKAKILSALNAQEEDGSDIFSDILSGAGLGLSTVSRFVKPMNKGGVLPDDPDVPENKDVYPTMLAKNEGVINSEGMKLPGVKELVKRINKIGLSLRKHSSSEDEKNEPENDDENSEREIKHMNKGGVIGEAKRSETGNKKSRQGKGTSLRDRISNVFVDNNGNIGDLMQEVGFGTLNKLASGNELPDNLDPRTMNLMSIINGLSTLSGDNGQTGEDFHRIEAGLEYNPIEGYRFKTGRAPDEKEWLKGIRGVLDRTKYAKNYPEELRINYPLKLNIHSHDDDSAPSDTDVINDTNDMSSFISSHDGISQWDRGSNYLKQWDYEGNKKRKRVGAVLGHLQGN